MAIEYFYHGQKITAIIAAVISLWLIWNLGLYARSSFYVSAAKKEVSIELTQKAIHITPDSADVYLERGRIFEKQNETEPAIADFERSLKLRPDDYFAWLQLGLARQKKSDSEGAIVAFRESIRLAPFYGFPHWYLGKILRQTGKSEEGWGEIRKAAAVDAALFWEAIDLAWTESRGNVQKIKELLQPETEAHALLIGFFLLEKGATLDAASFLCSSRILPDERRQVLVNRLITRQEFRLALMINASDCNTGQNNLSDFEKIKNGNFENEIAFDKEGFDWQLNSAPKNFQVSVDHNQFFDGRRSLKINFNGNVAAGTQILKQLVVVQPGTRYRLTFALKTGKMVSDSRPVLVVSDASAPSKNISVSIPFTETGENWKKTEIDFQTSDQTEAVWLIITREPCRYQSCPIFGSIWLDDLKIQK